MGESKSPKPDDAEPVTRSDPSITKAEILRNLMGLWSQQNTLIWGRLQTISVIQGAVITGWFATFTTSKYQYALLVTALGFVLSFALLLLIDCDLERRTEIRTEIEALASNILPKGKGGVPGYIIITYIARGFMYLSAALFAVTMINWLP